MKLVVSSYVISDSSYMLDSMSVVEIFGGFNQGVIAFLESQSNIVPSITKAKGINFLQPPPNVQGNSSFSH